MSNVENVGAGTKFGASAGAGATAKVSNYVTNTYHFEAFDSEGNLKWEEFATNLVTNEGLDDLLEQYLRGSAYTAAHYVLLSDGTPTPAAGDTLASHAGWAEVSDYSEGTRQTLTLASAVSGQSVTNSANKAVFSIDQDSTTIGGAGICTVASGTSGTLYSIAAFTGGDKTLGNGDTLNVTVTCTAASA